MTAEVKLEIARKALAIAAKVFREYEVIHRAKGEEGEFKARVNATLAVKMEKALEETK